ncbi:hypothetical protein D3C72_2583770 [compost metagenome]
MHGPFVGNIIRDGHVLRLGMGEEGGGVQGAGAAGQLQGQLGGVQRWDAEEQGE